MTDQRIPIDENVIAAARLCRLCEGPPRWRNALVDGVHPLCQALQPLEQLLDAMDDPSIEDETDRYRDTVHALLTLWDRLPRGEQDNTLHYLKCELASSNRLYAAVDLSDEDADKDNQVRALAAMRENGLEIVVHCVFGEDDGMPRTLCLDVYCDSSKRRDDFFGWLTNLLAPFGGRVEEVRYADSPTLA
jgi:hypothetical protein